MTTTPLCHTLEGRAQVLADSITDRLEHFAVAQEHMAASSKEDFTHWHHVAVAETMRLAKARIEKLEAAFEQALIDLSNTRTNIMTAEKYDNRWEGVSEILGKRIEEYRAVLLRPGDSR